MKKFLITFTCIFLMLFTACGQSEDSEPAGSSGISVVTTVFPEYDWVRSITGEESDIDLTLLLDSGVDLHSYQPSAEDIAKISQCDLFVYIGGESDSWVEDALKEAANPDMKAVCLMDVLNDNLKEEEIVEGMESEEEEEEGPAYDEHVWLSLKNAEKACECLSDYLCELDPENSEVYQTNAEQYISQLSELDKKYEAAVSASEKDTLLFGDRFPFRYMTDDYNLKYYAAFAGCSAESEASFETISFLAEKVDDLGLGCIMTLEGSDCKIAETILANTKAQNLQVLSLDSMQSITAEDVSQGASYLSIMEDNLTVLKQALDTKEA